MSTELAQANTGLSLFDSGTFEQMAMIASKLAQSSLIPETLKGKNDEQTAANCFRVVEQAQRWGLSPFAVLDSASVVNGKLMWEGKLIAAAIKSALGVRLRYGYSGEGENRKVTVSGEIDGIIETIEGTVADWKTTGNHSPWYKLANRDQMLAYRGARQWARRHAPEVILGVYSPDEMEEPEMRDANPKQKGISIREDYVKPEKETETQPEPRHSRKVEQKGRQTKERFQTDCRVVSWQEMPREGKSSYYLFELQNTKDKLVKMSCFGETIPRELQGVPLDEVIEITYSKSEKGLSIESWKTIDAKTGEEMPV